MKEVDKQIAEMLGRRIVPFIEENLDPGYDVPGVMHFDELTLVDDAGYLYVCDKNMSYQDCDPENFTQRFHPSTDSNQAQAAAREWCGENEFRWARFGIELGALIEGSIRDSTLIARAATATPEQLCRALVNAA